MGPSWKEAPVLGIAFRNCYGYWDRRAGGEGGQVRHTIKQGLDPGGITGGQEHLPSTVFCNHRLEAQVLCSLLSAFSDRQRMKVQYPDGAAKTSSEEQQVRVSP